MTTVVVNSVSVTLLGFLLHTVAVAVAQSPNLGTSIANTNTNENFFQKWTHELDFEGGMRVKWSSLDPYFMTMEIFAPTRGYVGVGFSPTGSMRGADIVIGWVTPEGIPMIKDYHGIENGHPIEDFQQDYDLIAATEREDGTTIVFRRRWETCDEFDMDIGENTMRLIWAWHTDDPQGFPNLVFPWHGRMTRGVRSVFMRNPIPTRRFPDSNPVSIEGDAVRNWDVRVNNVRVGNKETTYMCKLVKFPARQGPKHIIGFRPMLEDKNRDRVHHMTLYHCQVPFFGKPSDILERYVNRPEEDCFESKAEYQLFCMAFAFAWGVGSEGEILPDHLGIPLGDYTEEPTYFKFEVHYDNPSRQSFYDNSGLRIFYSDKLRQYDVGTLFLGHRVSPFHLIPQAQPSFTTYGLCSADCTQNGLNVEGIKAKNVLLHAHQAGKSMKLRHIRNGVELEPIAEDKHFDFNYQQYRELKEEKTILPGDELLLECSYDTLQRDNMTYGGASTRQEMCQAIMLYYPKSNLSDCRSQPEFESFFNALKIQNVSGELMQILEMPVKSPTLLGGTERMDPDDVWMMMMNDQLDEHKKEEMLNHPFDRVQIMKPNNLRSKNVGDYLRQMNWDDVNMVSSIEQSWRNGDHYMYCSSNSMNKIPNSKLVTKIPKYQPYLYDARSACRHGNRNRNSAKSVHGVSATGIGLTVLLAASVVILK